MQVKRNFLVCPERVIPIVLLKGDVALSFPVFRANLCKNHNRDISADAIYFFIDRLNSRHKAQVEDISFQTLKSFYKGALVSCFMT